MENQVKALESRLCNRIRLQCKLMEQYQAIPDNANPELLERKSQLAILFKQHFQNMATLCDKLEDAIELAITILELKKTA